jgi:hypothetical protein
MSLTPRDVERRVEKAEAGMLSRVKSSAESRSRPRLASVRRPYGMNERSSSRVTIGISNKWIGSGCTIRVPPDAKKSAIWR